jgi:hypothetical protein
MTLDPRYVSTFTVYDALGRERPLSIGVQNGCVIVNGPPWWRTDGSDLQEMAIQSAWYGAYEQAKRQRRS